MNARRVSTTGRQQVAGFALIEALVSLVILALGIMGLVGLQARTLIETRNTNQRAIAVQMTADLAERIQLNDIAARNGAYGNLALGTVPVAGVNCLPGSVTTAGATCTPAELAASDLAYWRQQLTQLIPGADVELFTNLQANRPSIGILIAWPPQLSVTTQQGPGTSDRLSTVVNANGRQCPLDFICHFSWVPLR
jgi:type IV pilus assembly protein PilV